MKKLSITKLNASAFTFVAILSATAYSQVAQASAGITASTSSTYIGADAVYASMKFKENYGSNIFSKKGIPGVNLFVGHMFNDNWGAEIGYEVDKKMKRTETVKAGATVAGMYIDPNLVNYQSFNTSFKQHHAYLGAIAKKNILNDNNFISLMLGVSLSHIQARYNIFADSIPGVPPNATRTFSKTKPIPVIRVSLEHKFNDKFGFRALATWKKTSKFKMKSEERPDTNAQIKLKNTVNLGFGVSYYI